MSDHWNYTPFLKLKQNEIMAIKELFPQSKEKTVPFFDFPKGNDNSESDFRKYADKRAKQIEQNLGEGFQCYLDTFDSSEFKIAGLHSYEYLLNKFTKLDVISVTGLNRSIDHKNSIINSINSSKVSQKVLGFRVLPEDIESFTAIEEEIDDALDLLLPLFEKIDLVVDLRVCSGIDPQMTAMKTHNFVSKFEAKYPTRQAIVTGSSISANISDLCPPSTDVLIPRHEVKFYLELKKIYTAKSKLSFGDYTVVSPDFIEVDIQPEMMRSVTATKLIYSYNHSHHIWRGTTLRAEGEKQYNEHALALINSNFYRGQKFSWADSQFFLKKDAILGFSASSMVKHVVNAHLEFMIKTAI